MSDDPHNRILHGTNGTNDSTPDRLNDRRARDTGQVIPHWVKGVVQRVVVRKLGITNRPVGSGPPARSLGVGNPGYVVDPRRAEHASLTLLALPTVRRAGPGPRLALLRSDHTVLGAAGPVGVGSALCRTEEPLPKSRKDACGVDGEGETCLGNGGHCWSFVELL